MTGFVVQGHILQWFLKDHVNEAWNNSCWKFCFTSQINYIFKYIKIENSLGCNNIHNNTIFTVFLIK